MYRSSARTGEYRQNAALEDAHPLVTPTESAAAQENASAATAAEIAAPVTAADPAAVSSVNPAVTAEQKGSDSDVAQAAQRELPVFDLPVPRYMPVALRGSHEVLVHQNIIADVEGLRRIQNDEQLNAMVRDGALVALPATPGLEIDPRLPLNRRYARPWVAKFLSDLSRAHQAVFGRPLLLTSAVRTVEFQRHLAHYNGNAAPTYGDTASPHLTGEAVDLGKKGMSRREIAWMRAVLGQLQASGKLDVEEEFEQACFHISVYETYAPHRRVPEVLVAHNDAGPDAAPAPDVAPHRADVQLRRVSQPVAHSTWVRHTRSYRRYASRHAVVRRRRHHRPMSLLAVRMR